jgi:hypothetical protein
MPLILEGRPQLLPLGRITDGHHPVTIEPFKVEPYATYLSDLLVNWMRTAARSSESLATSLDLFAAPRCEDLAPFLIERCEAKTATWLAMALSSCCSQIHTSCFFIPCHLLFNVFARSEVAEERRFLLASR